MTKHLHEVYNRANSLYSVKSLVILKTIAQILGALSIIFLARVLSPDNYGVYNIVLSAFTLIGGFASLGIPNVLQRYLPEFISNREHTIVNKVFLTCCKLRFISTSLFFLILYLNRDRVFEYLKFEYSEVLYTVLFAYATCYFQLRLTNLIFNSYLKVDISNMSQIIVIAIKLIGYLVAYHLNMSLLEILIIDVIAHILCLIFVYFMWKKHIGPLSGYRKELTRNEKKRLIRFAAYYNFNDASGSFLGKDISNIILIKYLDPTAVAVNALSYRVSDILLKFSPIKYFSEIIKPLIFSLHPHNDKEKIKVIFSLLNKLSLLFEIPILALVYLFSQLIFTLIGGSIYTEYSVILTIVLLISIINSTGLSISYIAQLHEKANVIFYSKFIAIFNILLSIIIVEDYGLIGVIIATGFCNFLKNIFIWYFIREFVSWSSTLSFLWKYSLPWGGGAILLEHSELLLLVDIWIQLPTMLFVTYVMFISILKINLFTNSEKKLLTKFIPIRARNIFAKAGVQL